MFKGRRTGWPIIAPIPSRRKVPKICRNWYLHRDEGTKSGAGQGIPQVAGAEATRGLIAAGESPGHNFVASRLRATISGGMWRSGSGESLCASDERAAGSGCSDHPRRLLKSLRTFFLDREFWCILSDVLITSGPHNDRESQGTIRLLMLNRRLPSDTPSE